MLQQMLLSISFILLQMCERAAIKQLPIAALHAAHQ